MKAIITVGISASGKTTYAKSLDNSWVNVNRDDLRFSLTSATDWSNYKYKKSTESMITEVQKSMVVQARDLGKNVIISDTNLNPKTLEMWDTLLKDLGYEVQVKHFPIKLEEAWKRDAGRIRGVGHSVIYQQWLRYSKLYGEVDTPTPITTEYRPKAVIFDVDGTLAQMNGRSPFDWHRVKEDTLRKEVYDMCVGYLSEGYHILIVTGRDGCCYNDTVEWLDKHYVPYQKVYSRAEGDTRPDTVIKKEIYDNYIKDSYDVRACVDDRPCMVRLWYSMNIPTVISVGDPYIEF